MKTVEDISNRTSLLNQFFHGRRIFKPYLYKSLSRHLVKITLLSIRCYFICTCKGGMEYINPTTKMDLSTDILAGNKGAK